MLSTQITHAEFLALCEAYDTLTGEAKEKAHADIVAYAVQLSELRSTVKRFASEDEYESWLSARQGW